MKRTLFCILMLALSRFSLRANPQPAARHHRPHAHDGLRGPAAWIHGGDVGRRKNGNRACSARNTFWSADKVVYVISGKSSEQLIPLAEVTRFRLQKNEMLIRIDDASKESHFHIKAMVLRPEWDRNQMLEEAEATRHDHPSHRPGEHARAAVGAHSRTRLGSHCEARYRAGLDLIPWA